APHATDGDEGRQHWLSRMPASIRGQKQRAISRHQRLGPWRHDRQAARDGVSVRNVRESDRLREQAVALRRAGKSVRQIKQILGPIGNGTLTEALKGEPPPEWTSRPNAK